MKIIKIISNLHVKAGNNLWGIYGEKVSLNVQTSDLDNTSLSDYPVESCKISVILFGSMLANLKGH